MRHVKTLLSALLLAVSPFTALAADELPVVRTVDLSAILNGSRLPVEIKTTARPQPAPSVTATNVEWRGDEGKEMARIAALSPIDIRTNGNDLKTVLRSICDAAQMDVFIVGEDPVMSAKVTLSGTRHPWEFLRTLATTYGVEIVYKNHIWNIYASNSNELVAKKYVLKNNTLEKFRNSGGSTMSGVGGNNSSQGGNSQNNSYSDNNNSNSSSSSNGSSSNGNSSSPSVDRSSQSVFSVESDVIEKEVQKFLNLSLPGTPVIAGSDGSVSATGARVGAVDDAAANKPGASSGQGKPGLVNFTPDTNTLYVVATRAQHALLADWLESMDKPLKQVHIETKFLLTSHNPTSHKGIKNPLMASGGLGASMSGFSSTINPANPASWKFSNAILTASDLNMQLMLLEQESNTRTVQYPQQTTLSGYEVTLRSVKQVPIASSRINSSSSSSTGISSSSSIQYVDAGTVVSILPKVMNDKNVRLNISITVSSITGSVTIDGNPYPEITNQTYTNQVIVESGYTLALGGLEQALQTNQTTKTPFLAEIPFFGFLFKDVQKDNSRSVLTMVVTPTVMESYNGGNTSGLAENTLPAQGTLPRTVFDARPGHTVEDVQISLRGMNRDIDEIAGILLDGRADRTHKVRTELLINELDLMQITLDREAANGRTDSTLNAAIKAHRARLKKLASQIPNVDPLG